MARETGSLMPPMHILNAPTRLMRDLGYGKGYVYDHATEEGFSGQNYFPDGVARRNFYRPGERGFEREIKKRLEYWDKLRERAAASSRNDRGRRNRDGRRPRTARCGSTAGSSGTIPASATAGSKSCCAPGRSGSTASAPGPATGSRRARRSACRRSTRRRRRAGRAPPRAAAGGRGHAASGGPAPRRGGRSSSTSRRGWRCRAAPRPSGIVDGLLDALRFGNRRASAPRAPARQGHQRRAGDRPHRGGGGVS